MHKAMDRTYSIQRQMVVARRTKKKVEKHTGFYSFFIFADPVEIDLFAAKIDR